MQGQPLRRWCVIRSEVSAALVERTSYFDTFVYIVFTRMMLFVGEHGRYGSARQNLRYAVHSILIKKWRRRLHYSFLQHRHGNPHTWLCSAVCHLRDCAVFCTIGLSGWSKKGKETHAKLVKVVNRFKYGRIQKIMDLTMDDVCERGTPSAYYGYVSVAVFVYVRVCV